MTGIELCIAASLVGAVALYDRFTSPCRPAVEKSEVVPDGTAATLRLEWVRVPTYRDVGELRVSAHLTATGDPVKFHAMVISGDQFNEFIRMAEYK